MKPPKVSRPPKTISNCDYCGMSFKKLEHKQRHERTHTLDRPYVCTAPECGKTFARQDTLTRHFRLHTRESNEDKMKATPSPLLGTRRRTKSASEARPPPKRVKSSEEVESEAASSPGAPWVADKVPSRRASEGYLPSPLPSAESRSQPLPGFLPLHPAFSLPPNFRLDSRALPLARSVPSPRPPPPPKANTNALDLYYATPESVVAPLMPAPFTADSATLDGPFDYDYPSSATPEDTNSMSSFEDEFQVTPVFNPLDLSNGFAEPYSPPTMPSAFPPVPSSSNALGINLGRPAFAPSNGPHQEQLNFPCPQPQPFIGSPATQWASSIFESGRLPNLGPYVGGGSYLEL